jgi:membrane protein DedA with SNARE-associated domain
MSAFINGWGIAGNGAHRLRASEDSLLYIFGHNMGWTILKFLCPFLIDPETCVLRTAESSYKRGRVTLLIAKFIPGASTMAAPLAEADGLV